MKSMARAFALLGSIGVFESALPLLFLCSGGGEIGAEDVEEYSVFKKGWWVIETERSVVGSRGVRVGG